MEFSDAQLRILIDERKNRNAEYHATTNKKKYFFWNEIAEKINDRENTNYFTGENCHKKFLSLTKAFYTVEKYKEGARNKRSLVGEEIYEEFSSKFWLKPEPQSGQARSGSVKRSLSRASSSSHSSNTRSERISDIADLFEASPPASRPLTPSVEASASSRPTTALPSFSQSANVIKYHHQ
uniref:Nuclear fusion protein KAR5 n=1 Tax=Anthurium amnicola TaxID=1678845 RepID=A0A1D1YCW6_9ARAE